MHTVSFNYNKTSKYKISKNFIDSLKENEKLFSSFLNESNIKDMVQALNKIGALKTDEIKKPLLLLAKNYNGKIRALALKNLSKLKDISLLNTFYHYESLDKEMIVRMEATSAIGRLRNKKAISFLEKISKDKNPSVVLQAIRGLLVFKKETIIKKKLHEFISHPNELIHSFVRRELQPKLIYRNQKHDGSPSSLKNKVVLGDVENILSLITEESIHLTFTSPPYYNAKDYSIYRSYEEYLSFLERVFKQIHRSTKEGRFFVLNTSPIIIPRASRSHSSKRYPIPYDIHPLLVKMGWKFVDDIIWNKPEASAKNRNAGFLQHRKPLAYKANSKTEMIMVYRKKTDKLIDWNIKQYPKEKVEKSKILGKYETSNLWNIDPCFDKVHSAVFPLELCKRVIQFYSYVDDLVFDPFAGSGTMWKAALLLERYFFLTEKEKTYFNRIKKSLIKESEKNSLFSFNGKKITMCNTKDFSQMIK